MIGPIVNSIGVVAGSSLGAVLCEKIPKSLRDRLPMVFGIVSMGLGVSMVVKVKNLPPVVLSILLGTVIGELSGIDAGVKFLADKARRLVENVLPAPRTGISHDEFMDKFAAMAVLFCASGTGIFGALREGMIGDPSLLIVKAFLDFFTAAIFATSLGYTLATVAIPQFVIQSALFLAAAAIHPLTNEAMIADFSAVGGFIMLATGLRICDILPAPLVSMLPALILAMPMTDLWMRFVF